MGRKAANEILDAANNTGGAVKEKRRYAQDGRGKQGVCSLSFLIILEEKTLAGREYPLERTRNIGIMRILMQVRLH